LRNPPPGSRAAAAREFGIDLSLMIAQLRRTPEERLRPREFREFSRPVAWNSS